MIYADKDIANGKLVETTREVIARLSARIVNFVQAQRQNVDLGVSPTHMAAKQIENVSLLYRRNYNMEMLDIGVALQFTSGGAFPWLVLMIYGEASSTSGYVDPHFDVTLTPGDTPTFDIIPVGDNPYKFPKGSDTSVDIEQHITRSMDDTYVGWGYPLWREDEIVDGGTDIVVDTDALTMYWVNQEGIRDASIIAANLAADVYWLEGVPTDEYPPNTFLTISSRVQVISHAVALGGGPSTPDMEYALNTPWTDGEGRDSYYLYESTVLFLAGMCTATSVDLPDHYVRRVAGFYIFDTEDLSKLSDKNFKMTLVDRSGQYNISAEGYLIDHTRLNFEVDEYNWPIEATDEGLPFKDSDGVDDDRVKAYDRIGNTAEGAEMTIDVEIFTPKVEISEYVVDPQ